MEECPGLVMAACQACCAHQPCVGLQALAKANTKFSVGLRYTGVNMAVCGRSEMIFPNGVGNLQKGERSALFCTSVCHAMPHSNLVY